MAKRTVSMVQIGLAGVDAGLLMIADPCYWCPDPTGTPSAEQRFPRGWSQFCGELHAAEQAAPPGPGHGEYHQLTFAKGHAGLGVVFQTAYGDGGYRVYALQADGKNVAAMVVMDRVSKADLQWFAKEVAAADPHNQTEDED